MSITITEKQYVEALYAIRRMLLAYIASIPTNELNYAQATWLAQDILNSIFDVEDYSDD